MLSKSRGQILRVAATLHVLFHMDTPTSIPDEISEDALKAAVDFVDVCNQHVGYISGRGVISDAIKELQDVQKGMCGQILFPHTWKQPLFGAQCPIAIVYFVVPPFSVIRVGRLWLIFKSVSTCIFRNWKDTCVITKPGTQQCHLLTLAPWQSTQPACFDHFKEV